METWIKKVKTRKGHRCWGCGMMIQAKSEVIYASSVDGNAWCHSYWCEICEALMSTLEHWEREDGFGLMELKKGCLERWDRIAKTILTDKMKQK